MKVPFVGNEKFNTLRSIHNLSNKHILFKILNNLITAIYSITDVSILQPLVDKFEYSTLLKKIH